MSELPDGGYRNKALIGAFRKGWKAQQEGKTNHSPYEDKRTPHHNHVTFSRAFQTAWRNGWRVASFERKP